MNKENNKKTHKAWQKVDCGQISSVHPLYEPIKITNDSIACTYKDNSQIFCFPPKLSILR